jgi:hypothetical protein
MCLIILLFLLARRELLAAFYLFQALAILGLSLAVLFGDRPVLVCLLHLSSATLYGLIALAHAGPIHEWLRTGRFAPGNGSGSGGH